MLLALPIFFILAEFGHSDRNGGILRKKRKNSAKIGMVGSYVILCYFAHNISNIILLYSRHLETLLVKNSGWCSAPFSVNIFLKLTTKPRKQHDHPSLDYHILATK